MSKPKQLVTLTEWEAYRYVMSSHGFEIDSKDFPFIPLFYPKLSVLFKENRKIEHDKQEKIYPYSIICTTIVTTLPKNNDPARVFCVIDVLKKEGFSKNLFRVKKNFFIQHKIPYYAFDENNSSKPNYFNNFNPCRKSSITFEENGQYRAFNYFQFQSITSFFLKNTSEKGEVFSIVHEPSLDMIMSVLKDKDIIEKTNLEIEDPNYHVNKSYFSNTSVDTVLCVDMPYGIPLFAIEYDGDRTHYNEPKQIQKDRVKNLIFKKAEIPLLRVRSGFLKPTDQDLELKYSINKEITRALLEVVLNTKTMHL